MTPERTHLVSPGSAAVGTSAASVSRARPTNEAAVGSVPAGSKSPRIPHTSGQPLAPATCEASIQVTDIPDCRSRAGNCAGAFSKPRSLRYSEMHLDHHRSQPRTAQHLTQASQHFQFKTFDVDFDDIGRKAGQIFVAASDLDLVRDGVRDSPDQAVPWCRRRCHSGKKLATPEVSDKATGQIVTFVLALNRSRKLSTLRGEGSNASNSSRIAGPRRELFRI